MLSRISTCLGALILFIAIALPVHLAAQSHYGVVELGELGGTAGSANGINDRGWISGADNLTGDVTSMATLWVNGSTIIFNSVPRHSAWRKCVNAQFHKGTSSTSVPHVGRRFYLMYHFVSVPKRGFNKRLH